MSDPVCNYQFNTIYDTMTQENYNAFSEHNNDGCLCFTGRVLSVVHIISHAVGIALKPVIYLIKFLWEIFTTPFRYCFRTDGGATLYKSIHSFGNIFLSPFTQTILLVRALFGVCYPPCYFSEM